ncbi:hypothetical protein [Streptomyces wuyuanensis]|uniref:hypothetical protein n=1 Tax=Streptomyces wuyuanensis TaxID=1196353 RepID=UPI003D7648F2
MLGIFTAGRAGEFAADDPTLVTLLGREPQELTTAPSSPALPESTHQVSAG